MLSFSHRCPESSAEARHYLSSMATLETLRLYGHTNPALEGVHLAAALGKLSALRTLVMPRYYQLSEEVVGQVAQLTTLLELDLSTFPPRYN